MFISDVGMEVTRNTDMAVTVPVTGLPAGEGVDTWTAARLVFREDPEFPRAGKELADLEVGDVNPEDWTAALTGTTFAAVDAATARFTFTAAQSAALLPGPNRYVFAVYRTDSGKDWPVVGPTLVTVLAHL